MASSDESVETVEAAGAVDGVDAVAVASAVLGRPLADPIALHAGDSDTVLLRCQDPAVGASVVVKAFPATAEGASSFAAEAAGLQVADGSGLTPGFLAADSASRTVVMADLGTGASLADVLLGSSAGAARTALLEWARACGQLAVVAAGRRAEFDVLWRKYLHGHEDQRHAAGLTDRVLAAPAQAAALGVPAPDGLDAEVALMVSAIGSADLAVFSAGDICPDNTVLTPRGIRFVDFEEAGFHSVFEDAAYLRMPFSTCWCVFRLQAELGLAAENAYRDQVCRAWPQLADDDVWQPGVLRASAAWTLSSMSWLLSRCLRGDLSMNPDGAQAPRTRQLMRYRWKWLAAELEAAEDCPVTVGFVRSLLAATDHWRAPDLPMYPALR